MSCDELKQLLDAYIDGELTEAEMRAVSEHAQACESCREELAAAQLLKDTLAHMDDDIAVPLQAQAAWRNAVRAEAAKQRKKKWTRYASAVAAVLVLAFGVNLFLDEPAQQPMMRSAVTADSAEYAVIARDGTSEESAGETVHVSRKIAADAPQEAMDKLSQLAKEYSANFVQEGEFACRIGLPAQYLEEFTKAAQRIGQQVYSETIAEPDDTAVVQIQIVEG